MTDERPNIDTDQNGPFLVKGLKRLTDAEGNAIPVEKDMIALCRCGASKNKPFCDGAHFAIGFTGDKDRVETYPTNEFAGDALTVVDDIGICCHAGECVRGAKEVFFTWEGKTRVSTPNAADKQKVIDVIDKCPSGSLLYKVDGELRAAFFEGREPEIVLAKDGPIEIRGEIAFQCQNGAQPVTTDHYTLCRCGASKNKPFCDGSHKDAGFVG